MSVAAVEIGNWLRGCPSVLVVSHERPDGDALGCLWGLSLALQTAGVPCHAYLGAPLARRYAQVLPPLPGLCVGQAPTDLPAAAAVVCLDSATRERCDVPPGLWTAVPRRAVANIDHHADNTRFGDRVWVDPSRAATAQMVCDLLDATGLPLLPAAASCLLVGLAMDTGGFRFANADADALRTAARLLDAGAEQERVMDGLFFREPLARRRLEAHILQNAVSAHDGRLLYAVLEPDLFRRFDVAPADTEGLIDALRVVEGVEIACFVQPEPGLVRFSLRARSVRYPVGGMARDLGGGGHALAAGAKVPGLSVADAVRRLLDLTGKVLSR